MNRCPRAAAPKSNRAAADRLRQDDPVMRRYHSTAWLKLSRMVRDLNPMCQRIRRDGLYNDKGEPCRNPSTLVHHLISPRTDPTRFLRLENVLALCAECHPPTEGSPNWREGSDYIPSKYPSHKVF